MTDFSIPLTGDTTAKHKYPFPPFERNQIVSWVNPDDGLTYDARIYRIVRKGLWITVNLANGHRIHRCVQPNDLTSKGGA